VLAWPVVVKVIPALAVAWLVFRFWTHALCRGSTNGAFSRATTLTLGVAFGGFLFFFAIPGAAVGWTKNLQLLQEWRLKVASNSNIGRDAMFQIDSTSNQSLTNAVHLFSDTWSGVARDASTDLHRFAIDREIADRHQSNRAARLVADAGRMSVLILLAALTIKHRREAHALQDAAMFGLSALAIVLISPLAWGHYFVFILPAALFVPLWMRRTGRPALAYLAAAGLPCIISIHYLLKPWCGPVGLLGLGTALWFAAVCGMLLVSNVSLRDVPSPQVRIRSHLQVARRANTKRGSQAPSDGTSRLLLPRYWQRITAP
jgi:hypothetical protein